MPPDISSNVEYLAAKKAIDQRSLNRNVWDELWRRCPDSPLEIKELGAGLGTMVERLLEAGKIKQARYQAIDFNPEVLQLAKERLEAFGQSNGFEVTKQGGDLLLKRRNVDLRIEFHKADITGPFTTELAQPCDLLIGNALLDLVDIPRTLPSLLHLVRPGGLFYFSITFDGVTHFEPILEMELDSRVTTLYHQTMDARGKQQMGSHSRSGRLLLGELQKQGAELLAAGGSDWVIFPRQGGYSDEERLFLLAILDTVEGALDEQGILDEAELNSWLERRRQQVRSGQLIFITHQLDVCGHPPAYSARS